jgi:hypothetical protein
MTEAEWFADLQQMSNQIDQVVEIFHTNRAINERARECSQTWNAINNAGEFWGTHQNCLNTTLFIAMGRLFDSAAGASSLRKFLKSTSEHRGFFSKAALRSRKLGHGILPVGLDEYVGRAWEPSRRELEQFLEKLIPYEKQWNAVYAPLRNKVYAHIQEKDRDRIHELYSLTQLAEVEEMLRFLKGLVDDLWQLYYNGHQPGTRESG